MLRSLIRHGGNGQEISVRIISAARALLLQHRQRHMTDAELDRHVADVGVDRVFESLDRLTAPTRKLSTS